MVSVVSVVVSSVVKVVSVSVVVAVVAVVETVVSWYACATTDMSLVNGPSGSFCEPHRITISPKTATVNNTAIYGSPERIVMIFFIRIHFLKFLVYGSAYKNIITYIRKKGKKNFCACVFSMFSLKLRLQISRNVL